MKTTMVDLSRISRMVLPLLLGAVLVWSGCDDPAPEPDTSEAPDWHHGVTYQVFVHPFADGSGDGIGDFDGLIQKLDYIDDMGFDSMWLLPIHPSPSYHKYDVTNYWEIHPEYGTMDDFERLLDEAHDRDIRVVIDLVVNHTARDHPWFQQAVADTTSEFFDFYIWEDEETVASFADEEAGPDTDNIDFWHEVQDVDEIQDGLDKRYFGYFWGGMPDLNFDNPAVRDSVIAIGEYWLDKGVDGFRLDAAKHIYPDDRAEDAHAWWEEFRAEMEAVDEDVLLVGEVWDGPEVIAPFFSGLHSLFNFHLSEEIFDAFRAREGANIAERLVDMRAMYAEVNPDFVDATFLTNHDQPRIMSELDDMDDMRLATHLLFTLPGAPYVYYGEEIGMYGEKPDPNIREPMLWAPEEDDDLRTTWIEPEFSTDETVTPVSEQLDDEGSLLNLYRDLIALRSEHDALARGEIEAVSVEPPALSVYERTSDTQTLLVAHNMDTEAHELTLPDELADTYTAIAYASDDEIEASDEGITLPASGTVILAEEE